MYQWIRRIHLFTSLFLLVFVLMYFVSGWLMIHGYMHHYGAPKRTTRTERLAYRNRSFASHVRFFAAAPTQFAADVQKPDAGRSLVYISGAVGRRDESRAPPARRRRCR